MTKAKHNPWKEKLIYMAKLAVIALALLYIYAEFPLGQITFVYQKY